MKRLLFIIAIILLILALSINTSQFTALLLVLTVLYILFNK